TSKVLRGEVSASGSWSPDRLMVELLNQGRHVDKVAVMVDGSFAFRGIENGQYELRVVTLHGDTIRREFVSVHDFTGPLVLRLPNRDEHSPIAGAVSMKALLNPPPAKAHKELLRSETSYNQGKMLESIQHLEKAIQIHPEYMEAYNNLGVRYMRLNHFDRAAREFQRAVEIDPASVLSQTNLALALVALKQHREGELAARRALALDSGSAQASYALALSLVGQNNCALEGVEHLKKSSGQFPKARLAAARLLVCRGAVNEAAAQLRDYLESPNAQHRQEIEKWLTHLEQPVMFGQEAARRVE
ncbi:MAG: tetratricopeptide repeat protein, partial [Acidobacteriia bacterium]|nr:tetratricopeptide repeat protein [Terriglobia bacterium]